LCSAHRVIRRVGRDVTALSLLGGEYTRGATAIEYKRIELELVQVLWRDSESPDEKVSRHIVCLSTQGRTLELLELIVYVYLRKAALRALPVLLVLQRA
jgi:hypothetical protein